MAVHPFSPAWLEVHINEPAINKVARQICYKASTLTGVNKIGWLLKAINFIDLTTLNGDDTDTNVKSLCLKAANPFNETLPFKWDEPLHTAAVCVYPSRVKGAVFALKCVDSMSTIKVASVAAGFPSGQYPLESRLQEVKCALMYGANEVDIVINRSLALNHNWQELYEELVNIYNVCSYYQGVHIKTILATGELFNLKEIYQASMVAMMAGASFIKTSTGKEATNATLPVGIVMCRAIQDFYMYTTQKIGFKPAGGIKTAQDALEWMVLIKEELGETWLTNNYFRIGASSLLDNIIKEVIVTYEANKNEKKCD